MAKIITLLFLTLFSGFYLNAQSISGYITDSASHQPIDGATVFFPQLKLGGSTDSVGYYKITGLPQGIFQIKVQLSGYGTFTKFLQLKGDTTLNVSIPVTSHGLNEVVITSLGIKTSKKRAPVPVTVISHDLLVQQASTNIIDALSLQPGLNEITTGPGISKPEINGLGYNRVLTLMDGERQEDFQWGDEHGVLIDPFAVYNAEIIRGPASLQYGANAVAGVVSFQSEPLPTKGTPLEGSVESEYQTNNGLIANSVDLNGNQNDISWDLRGSFEAAHDYTDPHDGYVWGTAYYQDNVRGVLSLNKSWGYSRLTVSLLHRQIEIPDGNRDSATGQFEFDVPLNAQFVNGSYVPGTGKVFPTLSNFLSYHPNISGYQVLSHNEAWWQNKIYVGSGSIGIDLGYTESVRHEIDTGTVGAENMTVHDIPYSVNYEVAGNNDGLKLTAGFNGMYEFMNNFPEPPSPYTGDFEIPNYHLFDWGGYGILEKDFTNLTLSGGLRYDFRTISGEPLYLANYATPQQTEVPAGTPGAYTQFPTFNNSYTGFSGSIGATYQLPRNNYIKLNLARSYRAPAINELTANELDPANVFKQGDPNLKPEEGYEVDAAYGNNGKQVNFEVDAFYNYIDHFIFADRISSASGGDSMELGAPVYKYTANSAILAGITAYLNIHPTGAKWVEMDNGFTYIYSFLPGQTDSTEYIPFTPAPRLTSELKFNFPDKGNSVIQKKFLEFGIEHDWPQNHIYSALYNELPSFAYSLFNVGLGANFVNTKSKRLVCTLYINCTNLTNLGYVDHTSRTQYFWAYNGVEDPTNFGVTAAVVTKQSEGIYNMGRNISFKVIFPFGGNKISNTEILGPQLN